MAYPTSDGVVGTLQWEGCREGADDLRYLATLLATIEAAKERSRPCRAGEAYRKAGRHNRSVQRSGRAAPGDRQRDSGPDTMTNDQIRTDRIWAFSRSRKQVTEPARTTYMKAPHGQHK